jgi:hypothetical protein
MSLLEIGCCGACCRTCRVLREGLCKGCKIDYDTGERDIGRAKCRIKVCCIQKGLQSCADCREYPTCPVVNDFYGKKGHKYQKYRQAIECIREHGYPECITMADTWINAYGRYKKK